MTPPSLSEQQLQEACAHWQKILRLQDWSVRVVVARGNGIDLQADTKGNCNWVLKKKAALIKIMDPVDYDPGIRWPQDMEMTLVHELLHLHMATFDNYDVGSHPDVAVEQAVDSIASGLVSLYRVFPGGERKEFLQKSMPERRKILRKQAQRLARAGQKRVNERP